MNKELNATSLEGVQCLDYYERNKKYHINPKHASYGAVLVESKRVFSGVSLKFKLFFRKHWYWEPHFQWKYGTYYFHWLFFMVWFDKEYRKSHKIIKDHLSEVGST